MKNTTSKSLQETQEEKTTFTNTAEAPKVHQVVDVKAAVPGETEQAFHLRSMRAVNMGEDYIEASEDIVKYLNPNGLGPNATYFTYGKGLRVYLEGTKEKTEAKEMVQRHQKLHKDESFFEGR